MILILLVNKTFADVITVVLNPLQKRLRLTSGEVDRWVYQCLTNFTVKGGRGGEGACGKREVAFKVVSQWISSTVDKFMRGEIND